MPSFRFLHAADLHIDSPLRGLASDLGAPADEIRAATRRAFSNLVKLALDEQVAFVLIAGDLFDGDWPDWRTGHFFTQEIAHLKQAGIPAFAIRGNHDAESVLTRRLGSDAIHIFPSQQADSVTLPELAVCIHGQSFASRDVRDNLATGYPKPRPGHFNIGLLHTAATGRGAHANYAPCTTEQLAAHGYDYWALGHVHAREILCQSPCWIVFPGNTQGRDIGESGPKGATLVTVQDGRIASVAHHDLDVVRWAVLNVDLEGAADLDNAMLRARGALDAAIAGAGGRLLAVRMILQGASAAHNELVRDFGATRERLRDEATAASAGGEIWLEGMELRTRPVLDIAAVRARADAVGHLVRAIDNAEPARVAPALKEYCSSLLDRAARLRAELGPEHPAVLAAAGEVSPELLERAKNLLLARIAEG